MKTSIKSYFMILFPSWHYSFKKVVQFTNTENTLNKKTATIRTLLCIPVPPAASKNPTHSRSRSSRVLLPSPAFGQQTATASISFPKNGRKPVPGHQPPPAGGLPSPDGKSSPPPAPDESPAVPGPGGAAAAAAAPRAAPAGRTRASLPHGSAQRPARPPAAKRRLPPRPGAGGAPRAGAPRRGPDSPAAPAAAPRRRGPATWRRPPPPPSSSLLRALPGTGSPPRAAREGKWRRPVEGRTSSRGWVECAGRGPRREGAGGARPAPAPAPPGPARGGEPRPPPPAPPSFARGSRRRLPGAAAVLPAQPGGRPAAVSLRPSKFDFYSRPPAKKSGLGHEGGTQSDRDNKTIN